MAGPVIYRVHEQTVAAFVQPGGEVNDLINDISVDARNYSKLSAPFRSGRLKANIKYARAAARGPWGVNGYVYANIGYARYVHNGTTGPIRPKHGMVLLVPRKAVSFSGIKGSDLKGTSMRMYKTSVNGQRANPFMARALNLAIAKNLH